MRARRVPVDALPILLLAFLALLAAAACAPQPPAETETATSPGSGAAPDPLVDTYLERYFAFYPSRATAAGLHTHDGELEDLTPERIDAWVAFNRETVEQLEQAAAAGGAEDDGLTPAQRKDRQLDRELLLREARRQLFSYETVHEPRTDPLFWTGIASNANVFLLVREDLPAAERLAAAAARAALLPRLVEQARATLGARRSVDRLRRARPDRRRPGGRLRHLLPAGVRRRRGRAGAGRRRAGRVDEAGRRGRGRGHGRPVGRSRGPRRPGRRLAAARPGALRRALPPGRRHRRAGRPGAGAGRAGARGEARGDRRLRPAGLERDLPRTRSRRPTTWS